MGTASLIAAGIVPPRGRVDIVGIVQIGNLLSTMTLQASDWFVITLVASGVFIIDEFRKFIVNSRVFAVR